MLKFDGSYQQWAPELESLLRSSPEAERRRLLELLVLKQRAMRYEGDPLQYFQGRLGIPPQTLKWTLLPEYESHKWDGDTDPLWRVIQNVERGQWTAVESGTGTGKTFLGALLILRFLERYKDALVVTTAPKKEQLTLHIWREIQALFPRFNKGELQALKLRMDPPNDTWMALGFVAGIKANEIQASASKAQGFHRENMLIIFEETPGINEAVMSAFENTAVSPNNILVAFGNPNSKRDTLHRFGTRPNVDLIRISGRDHPNVVLKDPSFIPGAQTVEGLERIRSKYGGDTHPMYLSRARGISPMQTTDSVIRWEWCHASAARTKAQDGPASLGVDVANSESGDLAAIARGKGSILEEVWSFSCPNANELGSRVQELAREYGVSPANIGIDTVGVGSGTFNKLVELGMVCRELKGGAKTEETWDRGFRLDEKFLNLRAQMYWQLRLDLQFGDESGMVLPYDEELFVDLTTPKFDQRKDKVIWIESKEDIRKRLGRSPNKGDAVVYWNWIRRRRGAAIVVERPAEARERRNQGALQNSPFRSTRRRWWE